jgi:hypothetical protein
MEEVANEKISSLLVKVRESTTITKKQHWSKPKTSVTCSFGKLLTAQTLAELGTPKQEDMGRYNK